MALESHGFRFEGGCASGASFAEYRFRRPNRHGSIYVQAPVTACRSNPALALESLRETGALVRCLDTQADRRVFMMRRDRWIGGVVTGIALALAAPTAATAQSDDPAWIWVNVVAADIDGTLFEVAPGDSPQPSLFRTEHIRFVAESADGGVDLFVRDSETDEPSRFRIAESLDALCDVLDCARVAAPPPP